jgi:hypothetical protein
MTSEIAKRTNLFTELSRLIGKTAVALVRGAWQIVVLSNIVGSSRALPTATTECSWILDSRAAIWTPPVPSRSGGTDQLSGAERQLPTSGVRTLGLRIRNGVAQSSAIRCPLPKMRRATHGRARDEPSNHLHPPIGQRVGSYAAGKTPVWRMNRRSEIAVARSGVQWRATSVLAHPKAADLTLGSGVLVRCDNLEHHELTEVGPNDYSVLGRALGMRTAGARRSCGTHR